MTEQRGGRIGSRRRVAVAVISALLVPAMSSAQVRTPRAPGPRLPPAPAAILMSASQQHGTIYAPLRFDLPPGTVGVRVLRQTGSGKPLPLTPTPLPAAKLDDGRQGPSAWLPYSPQLYEATNLNMVKLSNYDVRLEFNDGAIYANSYRLFGAGIGAIGEPAVLQQLMYRDPATGHLFRVWHLVRSGLPAGTYNWVLRGDFQPGVRTAGVPVSVVMG